MRSASGQPAFVPQITVTVAFLLALASVVGLVLFLAHLARQIRVETVLRSVRDETTATMRRVLSVRDGQEPTEAPPVVPPSARPVCAGSSGFLGAVDDSALLAAAAGCDGVAVLERCAGDFVVAGTPVGMVWGSRDDRMPELAEAVAGALVVGNERTAAQDVAFGLRQLTDVAVKALSPGINDPTTAVHALGHASAVLCGLAGRRLGRALLRDDAGQVRVVLARPTLPDLLELAVAQPRRYGAAEPEVLARLLELLWEVAWVARDPEHQRAVAGQLERLQRTAADQSFDGPEQARLRALENRVEAALHTR